MKTTTLFLAIVALVITSCKKHKDAPPVVTRIFTSLDAYKEGEDNSKKLIWYSTNKASGNRYSITEVSANKSLEETVLFGYYVNKNSFEFYGPKVYPFQFGQEKWSVQNNTIFKKPSAPIKELNEMLDEHEKSVTADFIEKQYAEGSLIGNKVTGLEVGDVLVFSSKEGKVKGLIWIREFYVNMNQVRFGVWTK